MSKFLTTIFATGFTILFLESLAFPQEATQAPPPVAQTLVREGDFAMDLARELQLGVPRNESEAESMLALIGIAPKNGWIADYPMTPDILWEIQNAAGAAASAGKLALAKNEAVQAVSTVSAKLGLPVMAAADNPPEVQPVQDNSQYYVPEDNSQYPDSTVVSDYYDDYGPPVVSYYPPPWDYGYLYSWVPFPFWCGGFSFGGFFILNDFDRVVEVHRHFHDHNMFVDQRMEKRVTNHIGDSHGRGFERIDPAARITGNHRATPIRTNPAAGFNSNAAHEGAQAIFGRSMQRASLGGTRDPALSGSANSVPGVSPRSAERTLGGIAGGTNFVPREIGHRGDGQPHWPRSEQAVGSPGNEAPAPTGRNLKALDRSNGLESRVVNSPARSFDMPDNAFHAPQRGAGTPAPQFQGGGGYGQAFRGGGNSPAEFHNGGGRFEAFRSSLGSSAAFTHSAGSALGGLHGGGGSFGGFHSGGFGGHGFGGGGFHGGGFGHRGR